jgi:hypothetical protein
MTSSGGRTSLKMPIAYASMLYLLRNARWCATG